MNPLTNRWFQNCRQYCPHEMSHLKNLYN